MNIYILLYIYEYIYEYIYICTIIILNIFIPVPLLSPAFPSQTPGRVSPQHVHVCKHSSSRKKQQWCHPQSSLSAKDLSHCQVACVWLCGFFFFVHMLPCLTWGRLPYLPGCAGARPQPCYRGCVEGKAALISIQGLEDRMSIMTGDRQDMEIEQQRGLRVTCSLLKMNNAFLLSQHRESELQQGEVMVILWLWLGLY